MNGFMRVPRTLLRTPVAISCTVPGDGFGRAIRISNLIGAPPTEIHRIKEIVMAKVIEFYVPRNFRNPFVRAAQPQPGKVIEFCSQAKKSVPTRPAGGVLGWLLAVSESDLAVGIE
jgi:hypothetical protein